MFTTKINFKFEKWYFFIFSLDFSTNKMNYVILNKNETLCIKNENFCYYYPPSVYNEYFSFGNSIDYFSVRNSIKGYIKDIFFFKKSNLNLSNNLIEYSYEKNFSNVCHKNCEKCIGEDFNQCVFCKLGFYLKENKKNFIIGSCENKYIQNFIINPSKLYHTQTHSFIPITQERRYFLKNDQFKEQIFNDKLLVSIIYPLDFK